MNMPCRKHRENREPICYLQVRGRGWQQEHYETASGDAGRRAAQLRRLGYHATPSALGPQVTPVGRVSMTALNIRPGKTGDEYLERVPAVRCERLNPYIGFEKLRRQLAQRPDVYSPGGLAAWIGRRKYGAAAMRKAAAAGRRLRGARARGNPTAAELTEQFHGRPARTAAEVTERVTERTELADLGRLVSLHLLRGDYLYRLKLAGAGIRLAAAPEGRQLYLIGGDQTVALEDLDIDPEEARGRDFLELGQLYEIIYRTSKAFHNFEPTDYRHQFGEETGLLPTVSYDQLNRAIQIVGGGYEVRPEGIVG